jgi:hypothetical protein
MGASLIISMIFSTIGTGFFIYGRKQGKFVPLMVGIVLGVYPYFVPDITLMILVGLVLAFIPYLFRD